MNKEKTAKKNSVLSFLLTFLSFTIITEIPFLNRYSIITNIQTTLQIIFIIFIIVKLLKQSRISKYNCLLFTYLFSYAISSLLNLADLKGTISEIVLILSTSLVIEFGIKKEKVIFVKGAFLFFLLICITNVITIILFPEGLYVSKSLQYTTSQNWLLGYKNLHILFIYQLIIWGTLLDFLKNGRITKCSLILSALATGMAILANSTTSIIGLSIASIGILFLSTHKKSRIATVTNFVIVYITCFISTIFLRIQEKFDNIVYELTNKHSDFVGRTYIWDSVLSFIKEKPILGFGKEESLIRQAKTTKWNAVHAHNELLEIIYRTGLLGFTLFIIMIGLAFMQIKKHETNQISKFLVIMIASLGIMTLTEYYAIQFVIPILTLAYNLNYIIEDENKDTHKLA